MPKISVTKRYICPVARKLITDPVTIEGYESGQIYERSAIEEYFKEHNTIPGTDVVAKSKKLIANQFAAQIIKEFREENKICTLEEFFNAIKSGKLAELSHLNYLDEHLEACDEKRNTALHIAAWQGFEEIVKLLLAECSNINAQNKREMTPVQIAAQCGHLNIVKLFLAKNKNLIQAKFNEKTLLHFAAESGNLALVEFLLKENLNPNAKDSGGRIPLEVATEEGHESIVKLLINDKSDIKKLLRTAALRGYMNIVNFLLSKNIDMSDFGEDETPLHAAASTGHESLVRLFLEKYPHWLFAKFNGRETPLDFAAGERHENVVKILLAKYEELKIPCNVSTLRCAVRGPDFWMDKKPYEGTIKLLITKYPHLLQVHYDESYGGGTVLHTAVGCDDVGVLDLLLKENVDLDAQNLKGDTALHLAAQQEKPEAVKLLLEKGANEVIKNNNGLTCIQMANEEVAQVFQTYHHKQKKMVTENLRRIAKLEQEVESLKEKLNAAISRIEQYSTKTSPNFAALISSSSTIFNPTDNLVNLDNNQSIVKPGNN